MAKFKKIIVLTTAFLLILVLFGCDIGNPNKFQKQDSSKLSITCTTFIQYDIIREIAGDKVNLALLDDLNNRSNLYIPNKSDINTVNNSDVFIYTGDDKYDSWSQKILKQTKRDLIDISLKEIVDSLNESGDFQFDRVNKDNLFSLANIYTITTRLTDMLIELDSQNKKHYIETATNYLKEIKNLENEINSTVYNLKNKEFLMNNDCPFKTLFTDCGVAVINPDNKLQKNAYAAIIIDGDDYYGSSDIKKIKLNSCTNINKKDFKNNISYFDLMKENLDKLKEIGI